MHDLHLTDLVPGPEWGRTRPGELAAAAERAVLEKLLSLTLAAQARLLRADEASASGWSPAEDAAQRTARAVNQLSLAATRLLRNYGADIGFSDARDAVEGERNPRVDALGLAAIARTQPSLPGEDAAHAARARRLEAEQHASAAYVAETAARLRRYEPDWETPDAFAARCASALDAGELGTPAPGAPCPNPQNAKTPGLVVVSGNAKDTSGETTAAHVDHGTGNTGSPEDVRDPPPPRRRRGAQIGNRHAQKSGRHGAAALAQRAKGRAMMREVRALCDDATALARSAPRAKIRRNRGNGSAASGPAL